MITRQSWTLGGFEYVNYFHFFFFFGVVHASNDLPFQDLFDKL